MRFLRFNMFISILLVLLIVVIINPFTPAALGSPGSGSVLCQASADAHVASAAPWGNFGGNPHLQTGYCCGEFPGKTFIYIKFDLSSIPAGSTIAGATLGIYLDSGNGFPGGMNLNASQVVSDWQEGGITWNNKPDWSTTFGITSVGTAEGTYEWTIPAGVVQEWKDNPGSNHGIVIHWAGEVHPDQFYRDFQSRILGSPPLLRVDYAVATPTPTDWTPTATTPAVTTTLTWPTPIVDDIDPEVEWVQAPDEWPANAAQPVPIVARAMDNQELAVVQIWVNGVLMTSCAPAGPDRSTLECALDGSLEPGNYSYWALAYDQAGNGNSSEIMYLQVFGVGNEISVDWWSTRPSGHPRQYLNEPCACDDLTLQVTVEGEDLSNVDYIGFLYDWNIMDLYPTIDPGMGQYSFEVDYKIPVGTSSIYYRVHVGYTTGFYDYIDGTLELDTCSNSVQDAGEDGIDCGGTCPSVCRECLVDYDYATYTYYNNFDFNFTNGTELALAQGIANDALQEYALYSGEYVGFLDTADEYMEAVAYYVDQHMTWTEDNSTLGWGGGQTLWRTVVESGTRGCGNDYCGDCEDFAILRLALLIAMGVSDDCVYQVTGMTTEGHGWNVVYYEGKFRIMDYGELGKYFTRQSSLHRPLYILHPQNGYDYSEPEAGMDLIYNYPGAGGCPPGGYNNTTVYCDVCP